MKNPLKKRFLRELKSDFGKYLVIALFMISLIGAVSGYLVAATSIETSFYDGWEKYNIEDGHITFSKEIDKEDLEKIEKKANIKFYDLHFMEEDIDDKGTTLRIFKDRTEINDECLMEGEMPAKEGEIAVDRIFAKNNNLSIGDAVTLNGKQVKITGIVALVDFNCLFENNNDMMLNGITFGVGVMSEAGYDAIESKKTFVNYAWKYDKAPKDDIEEDKMSEDVLDALEDVVKDYDEKVIQAEVDALYKDANDLSDKLSDEFENASESIADQTEEATIKVMMSQGGVSEDAVAKELGTTVDALNDFTDAVKDLENDMDDMGVESEAPKINLDEDEEYENDMEFSLDPIRDVVDKLDATGLYDCKKLYEILDDLQAVTEYEIDETLLLEVDSYVPKYQNKAVTFCMDDMSSDKPTFIIFDYLVTIILAFVFAVTISSTIQKEAGVIGTLRASGYSKGEMIRHYLFMPTLVTLIAAVIGNILGYTCFVNWMKGIFYSNFSLATYESFFNLEAFIDTTVVPIVLMVLINFFMLTSKLQLSPIRFLRRDLTKKKKRRAMLLNKKIPFMTRFRLRILFQNISGYITLTIGIFFGGMIAIFGFMFGPLLEDYADLIIKEKICDYQYVLMEQVETDDEDAEKYCINSLETTIERYMKEEISIYGIEENSIYIKKNIPEGKVLVSEGVLEKYKLSKGDTFTLKDPYSDKTYDFVIEDSYPYSAALSIFMNRDEYNEMFGEKEDYYSGYFSNEEIDDIESDKIATVITQTDLTKVSDQMQSSMGSFVSVFKYFGTIMLILLMYLMTKQIIEKNMQSIAMTKILGFKDGEIAKLYLIMSGIVVIFALVITAPLTDLALRWIFNNFLYTEITGYLPYIISNSCYVKTIAIGIACFVGVSACMFYKISKIEKSEALKNVE